MAEEFHKLAQTHNLKESTISFLIEEDYDSIAALRLMTNEQFERLTTHYGIKEGQKGLLKEWLNNIKPEISSPAVIDQTRQSPDYFAEQYNREDIPDRRASYVVTMRQLFETKSVPVEKTTKGPVLKSCNELQDEIVAVSGRDSMRTAKCQVAAVKPNSTHEGISTSPDTSESIGSINTSQKSRPPSHTTHVNTSQGEEKICGKLQFNVEAVNKIKLTLEEEGFMNLVSHAANITERLMKFKVNIGVTGNSGSGKSTLINTLRLLRPTDEGAAAVGVTEQTVKVTPYMFPRNDDIAIWDLPGVNTPNFPKETYIKEVDLFNFDALIICTSGKFTNIDMWLVKQAKNNNIPIYLIRTKIDSDVANAKQDYNTAEETTIHDIRASIHADLTKGGVLGERVFLVCAQLSKKGELRWDFPKLHHELIKNAPSKNTDILTKELTACSIGIIEAKRDKLHINVRKVAIEAGRSVNNDKRQEEIVRVAIGEYINWFGLEPSQLKNMDVKIQSLSIPIQSQYASVLEVTDLSTSKSLLQKITPEVALTPFEKYETIYYEAEAILHEFIDRCVELAKDILTERIMLAKTIVEEEVDSRL